MAQSKRDWKERIGCECESLLNLCILAVAADLQMNLWSLQSLPTHVKSRLLSMVTKRETLSNSVLKALLHKNVLELDLSELPVCDETLDSISICHHLHKLDINPGRNQTHKISSPALIKLFPRLPFLSILYMRRCTAVSDDVISTVVHCCPLLKELDVGGCRMITDVSLKNLKDLENLNSLNVSSSQVSDYGILSLVEGNCGSTLSELRLDFCQGITDYAIENIVSYCSNMKILIFHGCPVTDNARVALENLLAKSQVKQLTWTVY